MDNDTDYKTQHCFETEKEGILETGDEEPFTGGVYVLANRDNQKTYVGCAAISFYYRLRQHNREIAGGASATRCSKTWYHRLLVTGFRDRYHALSFEWYVKKYHWFPKGSWRREHFASPVTRRRRQIELLFEKFGDERFANLTLHDSQTPLDRNKCPCYDCLNKGRRVEVPGDRLRKITPCSKLVAKNYKVRFQKHACKKYSSNNCCGRKKEQEQEQE